MQVGKKQNQEWGMEKYGFDDRNQKENYAICTLREFVHDKQWFQGKPQHKMNIGGCQRKH